ncbi:unnamed protein product, partial [Brassica rapa]
CSSPSLSPSTPLFSPSPSTAFSFGGTRLRCLRLRADSRQSSYQGTHSRRHHRSSQGMVRTQWCGWTQTRTPTPHRLGEGR